MTDPYEILGIGRSAGEAGVRAAYLDLVRRHPPDRDPERFAAVRRAYEQLRDPVTRMRASLFELDETDSMPAILADLRQRVRSTRLPTDVLLSVVEQA